MERSNTSPPAKTSPGPTAAGPFPSDSTRKRGRPLGSKALAIREALIQLTGEYDVMTVRQAFYQLESRGIVPKDETRGYRPVQLELVRMRREGRIPWSFISDNSRWQVKPETWDAVEDAIEQMKRTYRRNLWRAQGIRVQVWIEKDALAGVVVKATHRWDVGLVIARGVASVTWRQAQAMYAQEAWEYADVSTVVMALFDWDAGGMRAADAVRGGFAEFAPNVPVEFRLLAVTEEQVNEWGLPTRPAKKSDPQAKQWGAWAVELDAIPPNRLVQLVDDAIAEYVDPDAWRMEQEVEKSEREYLARIAPRPEAA
jgi:hypothetical protein